MTQLLSDETNTLAGRCPTSSQGCFMSSLPEELFPNRDASQVPMVCDFSYRMQARSVSKLKCPKGAATKATFLSQEG